MRRSRSRYRNARRQSGIALILVLWVAALMVLFTAAFAFSTRGEINVAFREVDRVRAGAAAEAGLRKMILILAEGASGREPLEGEDTSSTRVVRSEEFDGVALTVNIIPQLAYIDINVSPEPLIEGLVEAAARAVGGRTPEQIDAAVSSILDWRDADSRSRPAGAERADYRASGRPGPHNHPFMSVAELSQVMNVDRALFEAMEPMVTVFSWVPQVDPLAADLRVLAALPGIDDETIERVRVLREDGASGSEIVRELSEARRYLARRRGSTYTVIVEARADSGVTAVRRAVIKLSPRGKTPVAILAWHRDAGGRLPESTTETENTQAEQPES